MASLSKAASIAVWQPPLWEGRVGKTGPLLQRNEIFGAVCVLFVVMLVGASLVTCAHAQQLVQPAQRLPAEQGNQLLKWFILSFAFACTLPLAALIRRYSIVFQALWLLMGLLPFVQTAVPHLNFGIVSWPEWAGYVWGAEFSVLDLVALALYIGLPRSSCSLPFRWPMFFYFSAVVLSAFQADEPVATAFYVWQLLRMFLLYVVVVRLSGNERFIPILLTGMALGLCFEACVVLWQGLVRQDLQAGGTFGHQNSLGLVSHLVCFPFLAMLLAGQRRLLSTATCASAAVIAILGASRATIGLDAFGCVVAFFGSILRRYTRWKAILGGAGVLVLLMAGFLASSSLERRFSAAPLGSYDERVAYQRAASDVLAQHPMGIGANNLAHVGIQQGYYRQASVAGAKTAGLDPTFSPNVHNIYWLTAAETGYLGIGTLLILLFRVTSVAFICPWRNKYDSRSELMLGLGTAVLVVCIHSAFEWITLTVEIQYVFTMTIGMIGALALKQGYWGKASVKRRARRFPGVTTEPFSVRIQVNAPLLSGTLDNDLWWHFRATAVAYFRTLAISSGVRLSPLEGRFFLPTEANTGR